MMKKFLAALMAMALLASVTACAPPAETSSAPPPAPGESKAAAPSDKPTGEKVTIELLRQGAPEKADPIFKPMIEAFEKENPNIKVNFSVLGWSEATAKLKLLANSGKLPDVTFINIINGYDLASEGLLMDLKPKLEATPELNNDLPDAVKKTVEYQGGMYWVPCATGAFSLWYNKELFKKAGLDPDKPPQSIDEMISFAETITKKTGVPGLGFGAKALEDLGHVTMSFYSSYTGVGIWDADNAKLTIGNDDNRAKFEQAFGKMQSIMNAGITEPNAVEYSPMGLRTMFRDGQIAMTIDGAWMVKELKEELDKGKDSKFMTALFPAGPAGSYTTMGSDGWGIPADCKHPDEAWKLLTFLMRSDNQTTHATQWGLLPILKSEVGKPEFADPYWKPLMDQTSTVFGRPQNKNAAMIEQSLADAAQGILLNKLTPAQAVDQIISNVESKMQ